MNNWRLDDRMIDGECGAFLGSVMGMEAFCHNKKPCEKHEEATNQPS